MTGAITAGTIIAGVGTAASVGNMIYNDVSAPSGGGGGGGSSGGSSSGSIKNQQYTYYGPHPSTTPLSNEAGQKASSGNLTMPLSNKVETAKTTSVNQVPAARDSTKTVTDDYNNVWANRLNKYLDYNTRTLG